MSVSVLYGGVEWGVVWVVFFIGGGVRESDSRTSG